MSFASARIDLPERSKQGFSRNILAAGVRRRPNSSAAYPPIDGAIIYVVDDDYFSRDMICNALAGVGRTVLDFDRCEDFLEAYSRTPEACLVLDVHLPGMGGAELLEHLGKGTCRLPVVVVSGSSRIPDAVEAMKAGAVDFIEKPIRSEALAASVARALVQSRARNLVGDEHDAAVERVAKLTTRQRQIMSLILAGHPNKNIASDLCISQRTVEIHRAAVMRRTGVNSLPALARLAVEVSSDGFGRGRVEESGDVPVM